MNRSKAGDFTRGALLPQIILFTLPLIATAILQLLFNTADIVVVGRWGGNTPEASANEMASVGACSALINLIVNLFFGLSAAAGICMAHAIGAKQRERAEKIAHTSVVAALVTGLIVTAFGIVMARPLLVAMGTDEKVLDGAVLYMTAYFCGMPANMLYNYCSAMMRSAGDTVRPLIFLSTAGVVNVIFNLIMVIAFGLGALGVGIATAVSQWISCIMILFYMFRHEGPCHLDLKKMKVDKDVLKQLIVIGIPAGIQGTLFSVSNVLIQSSINSFGNVVMAGDTAASNLVSYIYATQNALYHTTITFVGQNTGARDYARVRKCVILSTLVVTVIGVVIGGAVYLFGEPLLGIYVPGNEEVIRAGMNKLTVLGLTHFLCGIMEVACGAQRGIGLSLTPMIISLVGSCVFRVVWVYTIFAWFPEIWVLYVSYPISWILTSAAHFIAFAVASRKKKRKDEEAVRLAAERETVNV